jgi:hypothetical protein
MKYILFAFLFWVVPTFALVDQQSVVNIQTQMASAKMHSFGRVTPYMTQDVSNVFINPASIGGIEFYQLAFATHQLSKQLDYRHVSVAFPWGDNTYSFSYGSNLTGGFINTHLEDSRIYDLGEFSSGFDVLQFSVGGKLNEPFFGVDYFYYGLGVNMLTQVIGSKRRGAAFGLDVGAIGVSYFERSILNRLEMGASVINAVSTRLPEWEYDADVGSSQAQLVERQIFFGVKADILNYQWSILTGSYFRNLNPYDYMLGVIYHVAHGLEIRSSVVYDINQGTDLTYHFGTGLLLSRVAGIGAHTYDMSVDYDYTMYSFPRTNDPSHTFSVSFFGQATDTRPEVTFPRKSYTTDKDVASFKGTSDRNAVINVYNNSELISQVVANNNGKWRVDAFSINKGYNSITFRAKSDLNDLSKASYPIVVHYDITSPEFGTELQILDGGTLQIQIRSDEPLRRAHILTDAEPIKMKRISDAYYMVDIDLPDYLTNDSPFPQNMVTYNIVTFDKMGNQSVQKSVYAFVRPLFPSDKTVVYNDATTVLGYVSPDVEKVYVNGKPVVLDKNNAFSVSIPLNYGKQKVNLTVETKNGRKINYFARIICMQRFEDIPKFAKYRRDIEFLATLGYVSGKDDGLFYPEEEMTRRDVTLAIAKQKKLKPKEDLGYDPYLDLKRTDPDAGLISAAIDEGIVYAFSDGTFRPNAKVSVADAFKMLNNSGVIDSEEIVVDKAPIKRYEFALFFKEVRRYDQRVLYLMDWSQGFDSL